MVAQERPPFPPLSTGQMADLEEVIEQLDTVLPEEQADRLHEGFARVFCPDLWPMDLRPDDDEVVAVFSPETCQETLDAMASLDLDEAAASLEEAFEDDDTEDGDEDGEDEEKMEAEEDDFEDSEDLVEVLSQIRQSFEQAVMKGYGLQMAMTAS